ncbi:secreted protein [Melampsora americana]|nr:secreted protein [Melampsora americana]
MYTSKIVTIAVTLFAFTVIPSIAAPSPQRPGASAIPQPPAESTIARPEIQAHHNVKSNKATGRKHVSRRSPFHPDVMMARRNAGPLATATQLLNAASAMNDDMESIHRSLSSLQANKNLGQSTAFQKEVSRKLAQWQKHANTIPTLTNIHNSLSYFGRDKGTANLNKSNEMEVTLKNTVNSMKYSMADLNLMVYQVPALGPTLGPIVYQIKCILDDILNGTENTADALLNKLGLGKSLDLCSLMSNMSEFC